MDESNVHYTRDPNEVKRLIMGAEEGTEQFFGIVELMNSQGESKFFVAPTATDFETLLKKARAAVIRANNKQGSELNSFDILYDSRKTRKITLAGLDFLNQQNDSSSQDTSDI